MKIEEPSGYRWKEDTRANAKSQCYYAWGACIPECIMKICQILGDNSYDALVLGAANRLIAEAKAENGGLYWNQFFEEEESITSRASLNFLSIIFPLSVMTVLMLYQNRKRERNFA